MSSASGALESVLFERSWASGRDLERARQYRASVQGLGAAASLIELRLVEPCRLARALAEVYSLPMQAHIDDHAPDVNLLFRVGVHYASKNRILPLGTDGERVLIATADPSNYQASDDLSVLLGMPAQLLVIPYDILAAALRRAADEGAGQANVGHEIIRLEELSLEFIARELEGARTSDTDADSAVVRRLVQALLWQGFEERANGIMVEPAERELVIYFRTHGISSPVLAAPASFKRAIIICLKEMAGLTGESVGIGHIRLCVAGRLIVATMNSTAVSFGDRLEVQLPDHDFQLLDVIDVCEDALRQATAGALKMERQCSCGRCLSPRLVKGAVFCKVCGARVIDSMAQFNGAESRGIVFPGK
jgi:hypothetical protein